MKLYYSVGACSFAIRITLNEADIQFSSEAVDLKTKKTENGRNFLEINPKGAVPVLVLDNGETLTEGAAIQLYLVDHYGVDSLLPPLSDFRRYRILEWFNFVATELHKSCTPLFNPAMTEEVGETIFRPQLRKKLQFAEQYLQTHVYLGGESVSVADHYLFVVLRWLGTLKVDIAQFPALMRYFNRMHSRPSVQKSLQEEGLA